MITCKFTLDSTVFFNPKFEEEGLADLGVNISYGILVGNVNIEELIERSNREYVRFTLPLGPDATMTLMVPKHKLTPLNDDHDKFWEE